MNRRQILSLAGLAPLLAGCAPGAMETGPDNVLGRAEADPDPSTFAAAVKASGLEARLAGPGPFTSSRRPTRPSPGSARAASTL